MLILLNFFLIGQFQAAYLQRWIFPDVMCKIVPFAATLSVNVSIITLVAISLDRYYVILYPFRQKLRLKQCIAILFIIWIVSILMSLFKLINYGVIVTTEPYSDDSSESSDLNETTTTSVLEQSTSLLLDEELIRSRDHLNSSLSMAYVEHRQCTPLNEQLDGVEVVFLAVMQYIVPFFIISFTYFRIGYHIYFDDSPSSVTQNQSTNKRKVGFLPF